MDATDWPQILGLYELLEQLAPGPMVSLNRAVALAMVTGPAAGLDLLRTLESDRRLAGHHRLHATRAHLLEMSGDIAGAAASYREAARRTTSLPERRYLADRATRLANQRNLASNVETRQPAPTQNRAGARGAPTGRSRR
jgi:predicted RNA polymerase sigma factor